MRRRRGFTIVELLVAMALIMFMMAILSEAFSAGLKSFRDLKAAADMAERLRSVSTILRHDLARDHFDGRRRLSQPDFWLNGPPPEGFLRVYQGRPAGTALVNEGPDPDEPGTQRILDSYRATEHMLHFTVKLRGNERGDFFTAGDIPPGSPLLTSPLYRGERHYQEDPTTGTSDTNYRSQWAEVAYFLRTTGDTANGTTLYALHRRQWVLVPDNGLLQDNTGATTVITGTQASYVEMSSLPVNAAGLPNPAGGNLYLNNPRDVTMPARRMGMTTPAVNTATDANLAGLQSTAGTYPTMGDTSATYQGSDLILTDVVSFEVRLLLADSPKKGFETLFDIAGRGGNNNPRNAANNNTVFPLRNTNFNRNNGPMVFDTWSSYNDKQFDYSGWNTANTMATIPLYSRTNNGITTLISVRAIQITVRIWDPKTEITRQVTIIQDM